MNESPDPVGEKIISATLEILSEYGLKATTKLIAKRAGVNEITLFRRYNNKTALIRAAIMQKIELLSNQSIKYTGDITYDLENLVTGYQHALEQVGTIVNILFTEIPRHPELRQILDGPNQLINKITELLKHYQKEGKIQQEEITTLIPALIGPVIFPYIVSPIALDYLKIQPKMANPHEHVARFLHGRIINDKSNQ